LVCIALEGCISRGRKAFAVFLQESHIQYTQQAIGKNHGDMVLTIEKGISPVVGRKGIKQTVLNLGVQFYAQELENKARISPDQ
jgi:hypothetical protein